MDGVAFRTLGGGTERQVPRIGKLRRQAALARGGTEV